MVPFRCQHGAAIGRRYDVEDDMFVWFDYNDAKEMFELNIR